MLGPRGRLQPGHQEADDRVRGTRLRTEQAHDANEAVDVLQLLERLSGQKTCRFQVRRLEQPLADLIRRHFAVKELVEQPAQHPAIGLGIETRAAEIEGHLCAREQHAVGAKPTGSSPAATGLASALRDAPQVPVRALRYEYGVLTALLGAVERSIGLGRPTPPRQKSGALLGVSLAPPAQSVRWPDPTKGAWPARHGGYGPSARRSLECADEGDQVRDLIRKQLRVVGGAHAEVGHLGHATAAQDGGG